MNEYRKIEKDAALARRFKQSIFPNLLFRAQFSILRGIKGRYEIHHGGIKISDAALIAAATYSNRHTTDSFLPDKAIILVDEAASVLRLQ